MKGVNLFSIKL